MSDVRFVYPRGRSVSQIATLLWPSLRQPPVTTDMTEQRADYLSSSGANEVYMCARLCAP